MLGYTLIKTSELPFYKEVHALIERHPEYLEGKRKGVVHLAFDPGCRQGIIAGMVNTKPTEYHLVEPGPRCSIPASMLEKETAKPMSESAYRAEQDQRENPAANE